MKNVIGGEHQSSQRMHEVRRFLCSLSLAMGITVPPLCAERKWLTGKKSSNKQEAETIGLIESPP